KALVAYYSLLDLQERPPGMTAGAPNDLSDELRRTYSPAYHIATGSRPFVPILGARAERALGADQPPERPPRLRHHRRRSPHARDPRANLDVPQGAPRATALK